MDTNSESLSISFDEIMSNFEDQKKVFKCSIDNLFGYILYLFRTELDFSQEKMGKMMGGMSKSGYSKLENGIYSINLSHLYMLAYITNVPRRFINDLLEHLTNYCIENNAIFYFADDIAIGALEDNRQYSDLKKHHDQIRKIINTPLKEYSAFFGIDHVAKISNTINVAIKNGGKLQVRSLT